MLAVATDELLLEEMYKPETLYAVTAAVCPELKDTLVWDKFKLPEEPPETVTYKVAHPLLPLWQTLILVVPEVKA
jgi:hypothetical protein